MKSARFSKIRFLFIFLILLLVIVGGLSWYLRGRRPLPIRNVILISIDTCRADYLGCYGFDGPITPRIDEIAGEGILFKNAHTPVPLTLPAHCSMLTGTFPPYHQVHDNYEYELGDFNVTLAEILQKNGYATGAIRGSTTTMTNLPSRRAPTNSRNAGVKKRADWRAIFWSNTRIGPFFFFYIISIPILITSLRRRLPSVTPMIFTRGRSLIPINVSAR